MDGLAPEITSLAYAKVHGLQFYFTGKPCHQSHMARRRVSSRACVLCENENGYKRSKANPAARNLINRNYLDRNPGKRSEYAKKNREKNADKINARTRAWRSRNLDKQNFYSAKRYARKIAAIPTVRDDLLPAFQSEILAVYAEARTVTELTGVRHDVDHIFPISKGGVHAPWNLRVLLGSENQSKKDKWPKGEPVHVMWHGELMSRVIGEIMEQNHGVS